MMNSDFGEPPGKELLSQPFEQSFLSTEVSNAENSISSDELFRHLICTSTGSRSNARGQPKEFYQCGHCGRHFGRLDHVKRHCRSHVNERTYSCKLCSKGFNRKDLLDRHRAIHGSVSHNAERHVMRKNRTAKACAQCILSKTKCSNERPCQRCRDRGQTCGPDPEASAPLPPSSLTQSETDARASSPVLSSQATWTHQSRESEPIAFVDSQNLEQFAERDESQGFNSLNLSLAGTQRSADCHNTADGAAFSSIWDHSILSTDAALDINDDILMAMDLDWNALIQPDYDLNYEGPVGSSPGHPRGSNDLATGSRSRGLLVQEFFKRSLWLWEPDAHNSASMEEAPHLSEAEERLLLSTGPAKKASEDRAVGSSLTAGFTCSGDTRDALLHLVQRNSDCTAAIRCFPSPRSISFLLGAFVIQESISRCPFLHLSSFKVDKCRIELLSALIVAGCANFANRQIWKLGLALQERTRLAIYKALDHQNSIARDLDILKAHILWIEAGLWSGVRRKMEAAESAANNVPLMIRRPGAYNLGYYEHTSVLTFQDDSESLQSKWVKWTELECFKRCVFRAFMNDIQGSVAYMRSPRFYSTEITFGLPAAHDLWAAPDPLAWRAAYLAKRTVAEMLKPTLLDIIQDPSILQSLPQEYDCELSAFAALHSLWPQIVALQDAKTLHRGHRYTKRPFQNNFWLEAQRQDLYKRLADIRDTSNVMGILTDEARMVCELFMMALFVSFVDIEKLVGRFGIEESRSTTPNLQTWSDGDEPRYAMWHAGQVLKAAQTVKPTQLCGFYAMAVYQACLVLALPFLLEAISLASRRESPEPYVFHCQHNQHHQHHQAREEMTNLRHQVNLIVLNGPENMQIKSFLLTGQGRPALLLGDEVRALSNIEIIPTVIAKIFETNYAATTDQLPPMSEKLVVLVKELTKFTGR